MKIILFGATGMVGQGVLRECLLDPGVGLVLSVSRGPLPQVQAKLQQLGTPDVADLASFAPQLSGFEACFFCLGVSSAGMSEENYRRITARFFRFTESNQRSRSTIFSMQLARL